MANNENDIPPAFSPVGERGPAGDSGSTGSDGRPGDSGPAGNDGERGLTGASGNDGRRGSVGVSGTPGIQGPPGLPGVNVTVPAVVHGRSKLGQILLGLGVLFLGLSLVLAQVYAQLELGSVKNQVVEASEEKTREHVLEDCLQLYHRDVTESHAEALVGTNQLIETLFIRPPGSSNKESTKLNLELGEELARRTVDVKKAIKAQNEYQILVPKPDLCPHPNAVAIRKQERERQRAED